MKIYIFIKGIYILVSNGNIVFHFFPFTIDDMRDGPPQRQQKDLSRWHIFYY